MSAAIGYSVVSFSLAGMVIEEQFGPALPVIPYDSETEAVALAGQTVIGWCHCSTKRRSCPRPRKPHFA